MNEPTRRVRYEIFRFFLDECRPPTTKELAKNTGFTEQEIAGILLRLEKLHHIKLYDDSVPSLTPIAMAHPFSHLPTPYVVVRGPCVRGFMGTKSWWANCAWCAFGLGAMLLPHQSSVNVLLPSSGERCTFTILDSELEEPLQDYFVTFSPPPSRWWDDVRFACSTIQVCESRQAADNWFFKRGFSRGDIMDLKTLWKLSKAWYGNKHNYDYDRKTPSEVKALFEELEMISHYWST